jgi:hypothetical protein
MNSQEKCEIYVIERTRPEYQWEERGYRETFERISKDPGFARWLADPKSGRFLIIDFQGDSPESVVWNASTGEELIEALAGKIILQLKAGKRSHLPGINTVVSSEVESKLRQMCAEIQAILDGAAPR